MMTYQTKNESVKASYHITLPPLHGWCHSLASCGNQGAMTEAFSRALGAPFHMIYGSYVTFVEQKWLTCSKMVCEGVF